MSTKTFVFLGMMVGSAIGGYIPTFFGAGMLSYASIIGSGIGGITGIYMGYKLSNY